MYIKVYRVLFSISFSPLYCIAWMLRGIPPHFKQPFHVLRGSLIHLYYFVDLKKE